MVALLVSVLKACGEGGLCQAVNKVFLCGFFVCFPAQKSGCGHCIVRNNHLAELHAHGV